MKIIFILFTDFKIIVNKIKYKTHNKIKNAKQITYPKQE